MIKLILTTATLLFVLASSASLYAAYDPSKTVFRFQQKMAERGDKASQFKLGLMYETGSGVDKNLQQAIEWYKKAAEQSYKPAQNRLTYLEIHTDGFRKKHKRWLSDLKNDARFNEGEALFLLGQMYANGTGVNKSLTQSLKLLRKAAAANIPGADAEKLRVEEELKQLQAKYLSDQEMKKIKQQKAMQAKASKPQKPKKTASISKPAQKQAIRKTTVKPSETARPAKSLNTANQKKTPAIKPEKPYISSLKRNKPAMVETQEPATPPAQADVAEEHPIDSICSGANIFSSGCR